MLKSLTKYAPAGAMHCWGVLGAAMSLFLPAQDVWLTAVKLLAVVCCGMELLEALEQAEVPLSGVKACTNEVCPKSLLSLDSGLLKAVTFTSLEHLGIGRNSSPKQLEMLGVPHHCAANTVALSRAGRDKG